MLRSKPSISEGGLHIWARCHRRRLHQIRQFCGRWLQVHAATCWAHLAANTNRRDDCMDRRPNNNHKADLPQEPKKQQATRAAQAPATSHDLPQGIQRRACVDHQRTQALRAGIPEVRHTMHQGAAQLCGCIACISAYKNEVVPQTHYIWLHALLAICQWWEKGWCRCFPKTWLVEIQAHAANVSSLYKKWIQWIRLKMGR